MRAITLAAAAFAVGAFTTAAWLALLNEIRRRTLARYHAELRRELRDERQAAHNGRPHVDRFTITPLGHRPRR